MLRWNEESEQVRRMENSNLRFSVDSHLLGELGERLVTKNYIALSELIKNSYDADATEVEVRFINSGTGGTDDNAGEIQIADNGLGMAFEEVRDYWMRIATPNKVRKPISKEFGRRKTGSKGIGRFACQRIARRLVLETTAKVDRGQLEHTNVIFEWNRFVPGTDLTEIPCEYTTSRSNEGKTGLSLKLINLRECWTERDFNMLRRQVLLLSVAKGTRRKGYKEDPSFEVTLDAPEFPLGRGILIDQFANAGWGTLKGRVDGTGKATLHLEAKFVGVREYEFPERVPQLKGLRYEIARIPQEKKYFRDTKTLTLGLVSEALREQGGVRVYFDGFRVYPYGDPNDDWLGIDRDVARRKGSVEDEVLQDLARKLKLNPARVLLDYPRHRSLIGKVFITSSEGATFLIKMDREGLVENETYRKLREVLRLSLDWMTLYYSVCKNKVARQRVQELEEAFVAATKGRQVDQKAAVDSALSVLVETAGLQRDGAKTDGRFSVIRQAKDVIKARLEEADTELTVLRAVAASGPLLFVFAHEVKGLIGSLDTHAGYLESMSHDLRGKSKEELKELAQSLRHSSRRFGELSRLFGVFATVQKQEKKRLPVLNAVKHVVEGFGFLLNEFGLKTEVDTIDSSIKTVPIREAELFSILVNLISNAVKACVAGSGDRIKITARRDNGLTIRVLDNGVGLPQSWWEEVFEPLTADPENKIYSRLSKRLGDEELAALGRGSGLGLGVVRGIVQSNGGTVQFVEPPKNWSTCIEVKLP